ncbi:ABC transporter substrate-binding protein [Paenibacillus eucommiae]|uniref:Spermidine/putrescine transport system substrate-binding protein n=1 Tax=Paenibacillus eucommiae TaxID=1355755 RepID=A0ABS4J6D8_9BACL|nr:ABC transporter substrate-binding protein [Paenibacillus eucommiae]MBP1995404.1 putative spermidine/putrescine transport system substrate-binding protein [Paenibacillus eucommiae]
MFNKMTGTFVLLALIMALTACGGKGDSASGTNSSNKELVVVSDGGHMTESQRQVIYKPFEEKYKVKIREVTPVDLSKLKAMVESGNVEWDVVDTDADFSLRGGNQGLLEKLDYTVIKKDDITPRFVNDYGIGAYLYYIPIAYSLTDFSEDHHPATWSEFWDTQKFPGKRSLWSNPLATLEQALVADGVEPDKLYPLDVDRAFKSLDKIKSSVSVWWKNGDQPAQTLIGGDASVATGYNGRLSNAKKEGAKIGIEYNQVTVLGDSWVIPKGSKNKELAMKFIAFATEAEQQANMSKINDIAPANMKSYDLLSDEDKKRLGLDRAEKSQIIINNEWWYENYDKVNARYQEWLLKNAQS